MQHNGPVNLVFTGLYVWVVPAVTSGNLYCTFIRGVLAHPRKYTFDHGWERAELRASLTMHVSQKARSICARRHHLQWWRHAGDAGAREGVRPVPARRRHAYFRPTGISTSTTIGYI